MTATFVLDGQEFMALNAGPYFKFTEAISFFVYLIKKAGESGGGPRIPQVQSLRRLGD